MNFTYDFSTRETYLSDKQRWIVAYNDQIKTIRAAKQAIKDANRAHARGEYISVVWNAYRAYSQSVSDIQKLILIRQDMRVEAGKQYQAQHA